MSKEAVEIDGKPLKFTAIFDSKDAEANINEFLNKIKKLNSSSGSGVKSISTEIDSIGHSFKNSNSTLAEYLNNNNQLFLSMGKNELAMQKLRKEQAELNKSLRLGTISEEQFVQSSAKLAKVREILSQSIRENRKELEKLNKTTTKPYTKQDTISEIANAHGSGVVDTPALDAKSAFIKSVERDVASLNQKLIDLDAKFKNGTISVTEYNKSAGEVNTRLAELQKNVDHFNANIGQTDNGTENLNTQKKVLAGLSGEYQNLLEEASSAFDAINPRSQELNNRVIVLREENKKLTEAQKALTDSFRSGAITQSQYLEHSRNIGIQQNENKNRIAVLRKELHNLDQAEKRNISSIAEKSAKLTQLQQRWQLLNEAQRNNVEIGGRIKREYQELNREVTKLNNELTGNSRGIGQIFGSLRGIAGALGVAFSADMLVRFGKELFSIAKQAEGIELRFAKIGDTQGLEKLRVATKNSVADLELMRLAVNADNFRIPMDVLAKGLEFATRRANETGESVDYLVDSFVRGIGRKSTLILDNLGISASELNEEIKRTGEFTTAVGTIIDREMARSGMAVDGLAEKSNRLATIWENIKKTMSDVFRASGLDAENIQKRTEFIQTPALYSLDKSKDDAQRKKVIEDLKERKKLQTENLKIIEAEHKRVHAFLADRKEIEKEYGMSIKDVRSQLDKRKKSATEEAMAIENALNNVIKKNKEFETSARQASGVYSQVEIESKLSDAQNIYKNAIGEQARKEAQKEVEKWQKLLDQVSIKSNSKDNKKANAELERDLNNRAKIIEKWAQVDADYHTRLLTRNEQEVESVRKKYAEIRKEIEKFNKETKGQKISFVGLAESEENAIAIIRQRQNFEATVNLYQENYDKYIEFEELKATAGEAYANKELGRYRNTIEEIKQEINSLQGKEFTIGLNGNEKQYLTDLESIYSNYNNRRVQKLRESFQSLLETSNSFKDQEHNLNLKYQKYYELLEQQKTIFSKNEYNQRLANLKEAHKEELLALLESHPEFVNALQAIDESSKLLLPRAFKNAQEMVKKILDGMKLSPEQRKQIEELLTKPLIQGQKYAESGNVEFAVSLVDEFERLVSLSTQFDGRMSTALKTIGAMVRQASELSKTISNALTDVGGSLGKAGGWASIVGAVLSVAGTVWQIFEEKAERADQRTRDAMAIRVKGIQESTTLLEEQVAIIDQIYGVKRVEAWKKAQLDAQNEVNNTLSGLGTIRMLSGNNDDHENRMNQILDNWDNDIKAMEERLEEIKSRQKDRERQAISGGSPLTWLLGGILGSPFKKEIKDLEDALDFAKTSQKYILSWKTISDITHEGAAQVRADIKNGRFDDATAAELTKVLDQWEIYMEAQRELMKEYTGVSFDDLLSDFEDLFFNSGEDAGEAWSKGFDKMMEKYMAQTFRRQFLDGKVKEFYDQYAELAKNGLTAEEKKILQEMYQKIREDGERVLNDLQNEIGVQIGNEQQETPNFKGRINPGMTEQQANQQYAIELRKVDLMTNILSFMNTYQTSFDKFSSGSFLQFVQAQIEVLNKIQNNTLDAVVHLDKAVKHLEKISLNTDSKQSRQGLYGA